MAVHDEIPIASSTANGVTTVFPHDFTILDPGDLVAVGVVGSVVTPYVYGVDFTLTGVGTPSGSMVFGVAPANGTLVRRYRDTSLTRSIAYTVNGDLPTDVLNGDFDRMWFALQDIYQGGKASPSTLRVPNGETVPVLPDAATRANRVQAYDGAGNPIAIVGVDGGAAAALAIDLANSANTAKGSALVAQPVEATGEAGRTVFNILRQKIRVTDFNGSDPSGATSSYTAITNAIAKAVARGGDEVDLGYGDWLTNQPIDLPANVYLVGRRPGATRLRTNQNNKLIRRLGSISNVINRGGVVHMTLIGSGLANTLCVGIDSQWTNRACYEDLIFYSFYKGMSCANVWQDSWRRLMANGAGADQNAIGFYMAEKDPTTGVSNCAIAHDCHAQGVSLYGFRLINFDGSKFTSCEGSDGIHGWYLADPPSGVVPAQFGHFTNCLADTTSGHGWRFERGAAASGTDIQLANCWVGTSGGAGLYVANFSGLAFTNWLQRASQSHGVHLNLSSRISMTGMSLMGYDAAGTGAGKGILLQDSSFNTFTGGQVYTASAGAPKAVVESGTSDSNFVTGAFLQNGFTRTGANSHIVRNQGAFAERRGSATIAAGATSVVVTHGCDGAPTADEIRLTFRGITSAKVLAVTAITSTTFTVTSDVAPGGSGQLFGWAIDQIGQ